VVEGCEGGCHVKRRANTENYKALHAQLLEDTAKLIGHPVDALVTRFVALARLKMQTIEMQLIAGNPHAATAQEIDMLRQQLDPYMPKAQMNLRVSFVGAKDEAPAGGPSVGGLIACRRCGWTPPGKDVVEKCYACSWFDGCDTDHTPHEPLIKPVIPAATETSASAVTARSARANPKVVDLDEQRAELAQQRRQQARITAGVDPGPPRPYVSANIYSGDSPSSLMRRIERDYGGA
jgi:hypothetical protein